MSEMPKDEEDALVGKAGRDCGAIWEHEPIRLAIRSAHEAGRLEGAAQERERAAGESVEPQVDGWPLYSCIPPPPDIAALAEGFGDPETLWNSRKWLQAAVEAKGAKMIGGGMGCGQADIDIELEGHRFNLSLRPIAAAIAEGKK